MDDNRLEDIEIKLTRQEDLLDTLNMQVYQMQKKTRRLGNVVFCVGQAVA